MKAYLIGIMCITHVFGIKAQIMGSGGYLPDQKEVSSLVNASANSGAKNDTINAFRLGRKAISIAQNTNIDSIKAYSFLRFGLVLSEHKKYKNAFDTLIIAKDLSHRTLDTILEIRSRLSIIQNFINSGENFDLAQSYGLESIDLFKNINAKKYLPELLNNLGEIARFQGDYKKSLEYHLQALKSYEQDYDSINISRTINSIGLIYTELGSFDVALEYHLRNLDLRKKLKEKFAIGKTLSSIGRCYQGKTNYAMAVTYFELAIKSFKPYETTDHDEYKLNYGDALNNIGWAYSLWGKYDIALIYLKKSLNIKKETGNKQYVTYSLHTMGEVFLGMKDYTRAEYYFNKTLKLINELGLKKDKMVLYKNLAKLEYERGNYKLSNDYNTKFIDLKDSLYNEERSKQISYMQGSYDFERKNIENKILISELELKQALVEKQFIVGILIGIALLFFLAISLILFKTSKQKQKLNTILKEQSEEIKTQNTELNRYVNELGRLNAQLEVLVKEKTIQVENQHEKLDAYAFLNAHKLRAPLASILGLVDVIYMNRSQKVNLLLIEHLRSSAKKLDEVIREIQSSLNESN